MTELTAIPMAVDTRNTMDTNESRFGSMRKITLFQVCDLPAKYNDTKLYFTFQRNDGSPFRSSFACAVGGEVSWDDKVLPGYPLFDSFTATFHIRIFKHRWYLTDKVVTEVLEKVQPSTEYEEFLKRRPISASHARSVQVKMNTCNVGDNIAVEYVEDRGASLAEPAHAHLVQSAGADLEEFVDKAGELADQVSESGIDVGDVLSSVLTALGGVWEKLEDLSELHPYFNAAYKAVDFVYKQYKDQLARDDKIRTLALTLKKTYDFLEHAEQLDDTEQLKQNDARKQILRDITAQTRECIYFIIDYAQKRSFLSRLLDFKKANADKQINDFNSTFDNLKKSFMQSAKLGAAINLVNIQRDMNAASRQWNFQWLKDAGYDNSKSCHPQTSHEILGQITRWINSKDENMVLALMGEAGSGKSAVAHTIAAEADKRRQLGSSFFFNHAIPSRSDPKMLLPTLAYGLTEFNGGIQRALWKKNESLGKDMDLSEQFEIFLLAPAKAYNGRGPVVIVVDAVDEIGTEEERRALLTILTTKTMEIPSKFRILITARSEPDIVTIFEKARLPVIQLISEKGHVEDIRKYIVSELRTCAGIDEQSCNVLAEKSKGCWHWVSAACGYITTNQAFRGGRIPEKRFDGLVKNTTHSDAYLKKKHLCVVRGSPCSAV